MSKIDDLAKLPVVTIMFSQALSRLSVPDFNNISVDFTYFELYFGPCRPSYPRGYSLAYC
jgi:hypothetical protein